MLTRTSTIRSKLAVCVATVALVAGILATPAAAETKHKRWLPNQNPAAHAGNVEQGGRQVNHRYDVKDRGTPPVWQARPGEKDRKPRQQAREYPQYPPGHDNRGRRHEGRNNSQPPRHADRDGRHEGRNNPQPPRHADRDGRHEGRNNPQPPRHADRDSRHGDDRWRKHKGGKPYYGNRHDHGRDRHHRNHRHTRQYYSYSYYYAQPYPRVIYYPVPYYTQRRDTARGYYGQGSQAATCGGNYSDGGRYVMGGSHQPGGTILGGVVGAAIGSQIGGGKGRLVAVGVGTLIGALVGRDIGRTMDDTDRSYATGSFGHAMEYAPTCSSITWNNPRSGSNGTVTPTQTYEPEPGRYCREFQQEVAIGGQVQDAYGTACRQPDGCWEIVTE